MLKCIGKHERDYRYRCGQSCAAKESRRVEDIAEDKHNNNRNEPQISDKVLRLDNKYDGDNDRSAKKYQSTLWLNFRFHDRMI